MRKMELCQMREHEAKKEVLERCRVAVDVGLSTVREQYMMKVAVRDLLDQPWARSL